MVKHSEANQQVYLSKVNSPALSSSTAAGTSVLSLSHSAAVPGAWATASSATSALPASLSSSSSSSHRRKSNLFGVGSSKRGSKSSFKCKDKSYTCKDHKTILGFLKGNSGRKRAASLSSKNSDIKHHSLPGESMFGFRSKLTSFSDASSSSSSSSSSFSASSSPCFFATNTPSSVSQMSPASTSSPSISFTSHSASSFYEPVYVHHNQNLKLHNVFASMNLESYKKHKDVYTSSLLTPPAAPYSAPQKTNPVSEEELSVALPPASLPQQESTTPTTNCSLSLTSPSFQTRVISFR